MFGPEITDDEFENFRKLIYQLAGIHMAPTKKALVCGRLAKRLRYYCFESYGEYLDLITGGQHAEELQIALDLLTTNETSFFRESKQFDFLREHILPAHPRGQTIHVWSAACSSGEEPYSIAMVLAHCLGGAPWEVLGSDISLKVLERARSGHYDIQQAKNIPKNYLANYCLKGVGVQDGTFLIDPRLRRRVEFKQINLMAELPQRREFDVIFLRNVLMYFDVPTKQRVIAHISPLLKRGGYFFIGQTESLRGLVDFAPVKSSIYRKG
jgi:chemotaxis protein methyltransferase CheR